MKYTVFWQANNSTYGEFSGNNLRNCISVANAILRGETFLGNNCSYIISDKNGTTLRSMSGYRANSGHLVLHQL